MTLGFWTSILIGSQNWLESIRWYPLLLTSDKLQKLSVTKGIQCVLGKTITNVGVGFVAYFPDQLKQSRGQLVVVHAGLCGQALGFVCAGYMSVGLARWMYGGLCSPKDNL